MKQKLLSTITCAVLLMPYTTAAAVLEKPDAVTDYLCIGSQYTNKAYGNDPNGRIVSLGNFGGYITYYYADPITDDPNNLYGIDFYVIGNSEEVNIDSLAEPGQVYVSEDGEEWYAIAGSEHYEDTALWDYTITYTRDEDNNSSWTDSLGGSMDYTAPKWPDPEIYTLNNTGNEYSYSFTGILLKAQDGTTTGDGTAGAYASKTSFGYTDYYASNLRNGKLVETNPYIENPTRANGFDLAWAVDDDGLPVDVSEKGFHYIKVTTASNIYAGGFKDKSTEVSYVIRSPQREASVGKTAVPVRITIHDGEAETTVEPADGKNVYDIAASESCSIIVDSDADNIYINNRRAAEADGFPKGLVRIITQSGDMEPSIIFLRLTDSTEVSPEPTEAAVPTEAPQPTETVLPTASPTPTAAPHSSSNTNITVSFTLYGDTRHGDKEKHTYKNNKSSLPVWIRTKTYSIPTGSSARYLFEKALTEAGIGWNASGKNYISEINGLAEFDNGETSGWMYLINGDHAEVGINDQILKNGDKIIFHYTDDYTAEQGSEKFTPRGSSSKKETEKKAVSTDVDMLILHEHENTVMRYYYQFILQRAAL